MTIVMQTLEWILWSGIVMCFDVDELADEAVELTTDELTTVGAVDFSETVGGRSRGVGTLVHIAVRGRCVRRRQLSSKGGMDGMDRC